MGKEHLTPNYIFESSWEVCNKVGGIYTVLSSRAKILQDRMKDRIIFIGPDVWGEKKSPFFCEDTSLFATWQQKAKETGLSVRVGRWTVPGQPIAILVDFQPFFEKKNEIYGWLWEHYQVDSLHAYGDYDEASMFSYAAALVVESFYDHYLDDSLRVVYHANEWMCGLGALLVNYKVPQIATIFTTHATSIGRSIAGNQKPLYDFLEHYNGDQMAEELNMQSKHSIEKQTAHNADCFTTVSKITDAECKALLEKPADVVLMNGFENDFVPKGAAFEKKRKEARATLLHTANALMGTNLVDDTIIIGTGGRYEFKNKGIDVFIEAMGQLNQDKSLNRNILAFINVPAYIVGPRNDLQERIASGEKFDTPLYDSYITHWLHNVSQDSIVNMLRGKGLNNGKGDKVKVIFVPCYLDGRDGVMNKSYYDLEIGDDLCIFASYYEPWGYTPLESVAFHVPTITTDLAGFGRWVEEIKEKNGIENGVEVLHRSDYNYFDVVDGLKSTVLRFASLNDKEVEEARHKATLVAERALWKHFIKYYYEAYDIALNKAQARIDKK